MSRIIYTSMLVHKDAKIIDAVQAIDKGGLQIALVVDSKNELLGTITDGDIRRGLLKGIGMNESVTTVMNTNPQTVSKNLSESQILNLMRAKGVSQVPIVDDQNIVVGVQTLRELLKETEKENEVVIMAGGLGKRLGSLTNDTPKPLLKVGNKPILEIIIENFISHGFKTFHVAVNYKAELIKDYFKDGKNLSVKINYLEEKEFLGTAGALHLLQNKPKKPFIVMNGDLLTNVSFTKLLEFHDIQNASATMCVREYDIQVPYGVVCLENDQIKMIDEKPTQRYFVNAGIYVLNPETLDLIPHNQKYDMPTLFHVLNEAKSKTVAFPIREYWLDIGKKDDFEKAKGDFFEVFK